MLALAVAWALSRESSPPAPVPDGAAPDALVAPVDDPGEKAIPSAPSVAVWEVGTASGRAFESAGWLRWCFASKDLARLQQGVTRLATWLAKNQATR